MYVRLSNPCLKEIIENVDLPVSQGSIQNKSKELMAKMFAIGVDAVKEHAVYPSSMDPMKFEAILLKLGIVNIGGEAATTA